MILIHIPYLKDCILFLRRSFIFFDYTSFDQRKSLLTLTKRHSFLAITPAANRTRRLNYERYVDCRHMWANPCGDHGFKGSELGKCTKIKEVH
jgi:hypothetical protein